MATHDQFLALLMQADESEKGIAVKTDNCILLRNKLYAARRSVGLFNNLAIVLPPIEGELWLVKKGEADGEELE